MYQIDPATNSLIKLPSRSFTDLQYREREHLQEWIAKCPSALGEELLIIQKEFDGFDETRERLDLLALDKQGGLVVIENKLDDSGRDVVWQALKYAAYCSSLDNEGIVRIYQEYLDKNKNSTAEDAREKLEEFFDKEEFDELVLNQGNNQRIILVAGNFRKEVTCTALWLLKHDISMQCMKISVFNKGAESFLNLEQVIPPPEAADFMVNVAEKEKKEAVVKKTQLKRESLRREFWEQTLAALEKAGNNLYSNVSPSDDHWLSTGAGLSGVPFMMIFSQREIRVEIYVGRASREENKWIFDELYKDKGAVEDIFSKSLVWKRLDDKKACRIFCSEPMDSFDKSNWLEMIQWMLEHLPKLEKAFGQRLARISSKLKSSPLPSLEIKAGNPGED